MVTAKNNLSLKNMGQDTFVNIGTSVTIDFKYINLKLIKELIESGKFNIFFNTGYSCEDEIYPEEIFTHHYPYWEEILDSNSENEFISRILEQNIKSKKIFFLYDCIDAYAKNLSRRQEPHIFGFEENKRSTDFVIESLKKGKEYFLEYGIPEELIKIGYNFQDTY